SDREGARGRRSPRRARAAAGERQAAVGGIEGPGGALPEHDGRAKRSNESPASFAGRSRRARSQERASAAVVDGFPFPSGIFFLAEPRVMSHRPILHLSVVTRSMEDVEMSSLSLRVATLALGALATMSLGPAFAADRASKRYAPIRFAAYGDCWGGRPDAAKVLWVHANNRQWYYATFMGPCIGLNFANAVGFDTHPMGTFDRFSAVVVPRWGRCQ